MRKPSKIALGALVAAVVLFVAALPFGNPVGGVLFVLSVAAAAVFVLVGIYSLATRSRARAGAGAS